jgi:hypothetical protein
LSELGLICDESDPSVSAEDQRDLIVWLPSPSPVLAGITSEIVAGAGLVAEPFVDIEGTLVLAGGFAVITAVMGDCTEPVVAVSHASLIAGPFVDVEGAFTRDG